MGEWISQASNTFERYGAVGDGVTDDRASINSAITAALSSGEPLTILPKTYFIGSSLSYTGIDGLTIQGAGKSRSILKFVASSLTFDASNAVLSFTGNNLNLSGFAIKNPNLSSASASPQKDVLNIGVGNVNLTDIWVYGGHQLNGIHFAASSDVVLNHVRSEMNLFGVRTDGGSQSLTYINCGFTNNQSGEISLIGYSGSSGYSDQDVQTFIACVLDEGGSTINLGPHSRFKFLDCKLLSGQSASYAVNFRNNSGGGGVCVFEGGYIGDWASNQTSASGGVDSGSSGRGTLIFDRVKLRAYTGSKVTNIQVGSSYALVYRNCTFAGGTRDEAGAASVSESSDVLPSMVGLPAADPHVAGRLWTNSGVLTVSAG